jgi:hypothetical protein
MKPAQQRDGKARRSFFQTIAGCLGLAAAGCTATTEPRPAPDTETAAIPFAEGQQVALEISAEQVIERAYVLGERYEREMKGCAQCTVAALQDAVSFVPADHGVFLASSCVDGGATPTKNANCGSFTGAGMVIGNVCGRSRESFSGNSRLSHKLIRRLYDRYEEAYGSVLCKDIRAASGAQCPQVVGEAARWTAAILLEEFAGYSPESAAAQSDKIRSESEESST